MNQPVLPDIIGVQKFLDELVQLEKKHSVQLGLPALGGLLVQHRVKGDIGVFFTHDAVLDKYVTKDQNGNDVSLDEIERRIGRAFYEHVVLQSSGDKISAMLVMNEKVKPMVDRLTAYYNEHEKAIKEHANKKDNKP